jgi:hypothetical protein
MRGLSREVALGDPNFLGLVIEDYSPLSQLKHLMGIFLIAPSLSSMCSFAMNKIICLIFSYKNKRAFFISPLSALSVIFSWIIDSL